VKQTTRSAAALVSTSLIAGGGIAAAVTGLGHQAPAPATSTASPAPDAALSAAVRELLDRSQALHGRLTTTRHELRVLDRRVQHQRLVAEHLAATPPQAPRAAAPAPAPAAEPPTHTTTGASSASAAPKVHTSTRASSATAAPKVHTSTRASSATAAPKVHTSTRASGSAGPAVHATTRASGAAGGEREGGGDD